MVDIRDALEKQGYTNLKKRILISVLVLIVAGILFITFFFFVYPRQCNDPECFSEALSKCSRVSYIKEDSKAAWYYEITGVNNKNSCKINVKLLEMKQGSIDTEILQGTEMKCEINRADTRPPEENINQCSGLLKERLQEIIIERMHSYILKNLGEIKESFTP